MFPNLNPSRLESNHTILASLWRENTHTLVSIDMQKQEEAEEQASCSSSMPIVASQEKIIGYAI